MRLSQCTPLQKAFALSLAVHTLIVVAMLFVKSEVRMPDTAFAEMSFMTRTPPVTTPPQKPQPLPPEPSQEKSKDQSNPPVDLPKRRMLEPETPQLSQRSSKKIAAPTQEVQSSRTTTHHTKSGVSTATTAAKQSPSGTSHDRLIESPQSGLNRTRKTETPFRIEGDAADRTIIDKVLPDYPSGLQREARVRLHFAVYPDGRVGRIMPAIKTDPVLENRSIEALRQWRFDSLSATQTQQTVTGTITFIFKLQ